MKINKMLHNYHNTSTFRTLMVLFLVVVLPLIFFGTVVVNISSQRLSDELQRSIQVQMSSCLSKLSGDIDRIQLLALDLLGDKDANQLAKAPELYTQYEKTAAILRVQQRLTAIKNSSPYITSVQIFFPSLGWAVNSDGYIGGSYTEISKSDITKEAYIRSNTPSGLVFRQNQLFLPINYYDDVNSVMYFIIKITFSPSELKKTLEQTVGPANTKFIFDLESEGYSIENVGNDALSTHVRQLKNSSVTEIKDGGNRQLVFCENSSYFGAAYYKIIPSSELLAPMNMLSVLSICFFVAVIICICVYFSITYRMVNKPLIDMLNAFKKIEQGDFSVRLLERTRNDFGYLYKGFNKMSTNLSILIDQVYTQNMLIQTAELKQLQAQINPHFLYNSYFLLHRLIKKEDYDKAVRFSKEMGSYFKYITRNGSDIVSLEQENEHAKTYADIQAMRFEGRIKLYYESIPPECVNMQVPRLILQPIIENAFNYGLENKATDGILRVSFTLREHGLSIFVEDNGETLTDADIERIRTRLVRQEQNTPAAQEVTGVDNINRRIHILFNGESGLYVSRSNLGGLKVELLLLENEREVNHAPTADCG